VVVDAIVNYSTVILLFNSFSMFQRSKKRENTRSKEGGKKERKEKKENRVLKGVK
jgi:hypothetical protein